MGKIPKKTLEDLEYYEVLRQCADFAITPLGKQACLSLQPKTAIKELLEDLKAVSEYHASFDNENRIPNHGFEPLISIFSLLSVENSVLDISVFRIIAANTEITNTLLIFLVKFKTYYPTLYSYTDNLYVDKEIKKTIDAVIDRFGEVRDNASESLYQIRKQIQQLRSKISSSFNKALSQCQSAEYLDDIRESVVENRRVLAVKAMHRRKVKGAIMGSSKTGSIVFMEPEATHAQNRELQNLLFEEGEEIKKILSVLTDYFRPHLSYLKLQHEFLLSIDMVFAKARYAQEIGGVLPLIDLTDRRIEYKAAFHPLLLQSNRLEDKTTYPQDILLHPKKRIVVISGPNAGGKSITLKTV